MIRTTLATLALVSFVGCISVKTESEVKPIHITMDINLKVDKELDKAFKDENMQKPQGHFKEVKAILDRQVAGVNSAALLEARAGATDDDRIFIAEENSRRMRRFNEIATSSGVKVEAVQKRYAKQSRERIPAGSGVWIQGEDGAWTQR